MKQGNRIHFLVPDGEGMFTDVEYMKTNEVMVLKHIGYMMDHKKLPLDAETLRWTGVYETYRLSENKEGTLLTVKVDTLDAYLKHMKEKFPLALQRLKVLAEAPEA